MDGVWRMSGGVWMLFGGCGKAVWCICKLEGVGRLSAGCEEAAWRV